MKAEVITVGSELLAAGAANTNLTEICTRLNEIGIEVAFASTVGDIESRIASVISIALDRCDVIVITGGLGPTHDDVTREALAAATGRPLKFHEELLEEITAFFERRGRKMTDLNSRQAQLPTGARALSNPTGTAPGIELEHLGALVFALPGVPSEMRSMFDSAVMPALTKLAGGAVLVTRSLKAAGIGESDLAARIAPIIDSCLQSGSPEITLLASVGQVVIQIRAGGPDREEALEWISPIEVQIRGELGEIIFGSDEDSLESVVSTLLRQGQHTISVAESFTGGALTSRLVSVPGASTVLKAGYVTYATEAKISELGVPIDILERYGAVSEETALAMAEKVRERGSSDFGLSTTGEAGPLPGEKPVGTMFIGVAWEGGSLARKFLVAGNREDVRAWGTNAALNTLRLRLLEEKNS